MNDLGGQKARDTLASSAVPRSVQMYGVLAESSGA
jgi:hypothetical protein